MSKFEFSRPDRSAPANLEGLSEAARESLANKSGDDEMRDSNVDHFEAAPMSVLEWAADDLADQDIFGQWQKYNLTTGESPSNLYELIRTNPNTVASLNNLYAAKIALKASGLTTQDDENVGDSMHLILIPWGELGRLNIQEYISLFWQLRDKLRANQFNLVSPVQVTGNIGQILADDGYLYRSKSDPNDYIRTSTYVRQNISQFGSWGLMLAQTGYFSGTKSYMAKSPDELTNSGQDQYTIGGQPVGDMGVLEWLMLSMQIDPKSLEFSQGFWLLANRFQDGTKVNFVATGRGDPTYIGVNSGKSDIALHACQPRLGVIA